MAQINIILQGKGGVGKSFISSLLAQYTIYKGIKPICFDTDQMSRTFAAYKAFDCESTSVENLFTKLLKLHSEDVAIVDTGANSFIAMSAYLRESQAIEVLRNAGHDVRIHTILTGGGGFIDTAKGLLHLLKMFKSEQYILWLNPHISGEVTHNGKPYDQTPSYQTNAHRFLTTINLPVLMGGLFDADIRKLQELKITFAEAAQSEEFHVVSKARLKRMQAELFGILDNAAL